jgi:2-polyprenyl-6-methoxyphenol hydroxylase-like FAD-dependent oxidoreductase
VKVVVNGAGIAGPTLAWWLLRSGHEVVLVEEATRLRHGGYIIDFWGLGYDVAERMGLLPEILRAGYRVREVRFVDAQGRRQGGFPTEVFARATGGRFTSVRRSDLSATIHRALEGRVEMRFGDSVAAIAHEGERVRVAFDHSAECLADLVVGADGLHSRVRALAFGADSPPEIPLGYHVAAFEAQGYRPRDELVYVSHSVAGRQVSRFAMRGDRTMFLFVFRDEYLEGSRPQGDAAHKAALASVFSKVGWECPAILAAMQGAGPIYFDSVSQVRMQRWHRGRVALVGDAASCVSLLAGEGTGLAMTQAYVLAGELRAGGGLDAALARYEKRLAPLLRRKQRSAARFATTFAPATGFGVAVRNRLASLLRVPFLAPILVGSSVRDGMRLPEYG